MTPDTAQEKVTKAKIWLQKTHPFWARLILSLNIRQAKQDELPANALAGIDAHGNMIYSEQSFDKLNLESIRYIMAHEVAHLMLNHMLRLNNRDKMRWNIACDLIINNMLNIDGFIPPKEGLIPSNNEYDLNGQIIKDINNKCAEELYDEIVDNKDNQDSYSKSSIDHHKFEALSDKEKEQIAQTWKQNALDAANYAKLKGTETGSFQKMVDELIDPKVNWKYLLYKYITDSIPFDYTFNQRSRKSVALGMYLPRTKKEMLEVVVHIDTSGSIDQKMLTEFVTEIVSIAREFNNVNMTLIECDCTIKQVLEIKNGNIDKIMNLKIKGGGGTSHQPLWSHIEEEIPNCKLLISLTDGYSDIEEKDNPGYDVIFAMPKHNNLKPSFGEVVEI